MDDSVHLADELLAMIFAYVQNRNTLHSLSLTSRRFNSIITEHLYRNYEYIDSRRSPDQNLQPFIRSLQTKPELRNHVKSIRIDERAYAPWKQSLMNLPKFSRLVSGNRSTYLDQLHHLINHWQAEYARRCIHGCSDNTYESPQYVNFRKWVNTMRFDSRGRFIVWATLLQDVDFMYYLCNEIAPEVHPMTPLEWLLSYFEEEELHTQTLLLIIMCPKLETLHLAPFARSGDPETQQYTLNALSKTSRELFRLKARQCPDFHSFSNLNHLILDLPKGFLKDSRPLRPTNFYEILCLPSLRNLTLNKVQNCHCDFRFGAHWQSHEWGLYSPIQSLFLNGTELPQHFDSYFTGVFPYLKTFHQQVECGSDGYLLCEALDKCSTTGLEEAEVYRSMTCFDDTWALRGTEKTASGWGRLDKVKHLAVGAPPFCMIYSWSPELSIERAAEKLCTAFPSSLVSLTLLTDPYCLFEFENLLHDGLAPPHEMNVSETFETTLKLVQDSVTATVEEIQIKVWAPEIWARIWTAATQLDYFVNLEKVSLEFRYGQASLCGLGRPRPHHDLPAPQSRITVWSRGLS